MSKKDPNALYHVIALTKPGPKWREVSDGPVSRSKAAGIVAAEWAQGNMARLKPSSLAAVA